MSLAQSITVSDTQQLHQCVPVNEPVSLRRVLNLCIAAMGPFGWVFHRSSSDHIQVNVDDTLNQMPTRLDCRCVIAVFPKGASSVFSPVVSLSGTARQKLNTLRDDLTAVPVINEKMHVVGSDGVIEDDNPKPLLGFKKSIEPNLPILGKLQQEFLFVTTMRYMLNMAGNVMPARSWHVSFSPRLIDLLTGKILILSSNKPPY
jgi:hypothetical protein